METLGVKDPADLYKLTLGDLLRLENFKEKSAGNLLSSIEASKNRELWRLIFALGILEIGEQFAKDLARKYGTLDALMEAPLEDLESNQGFGSRSKKKDADSSGGSVRALSIRAFFDDPNNRALIERLRAAGLNFGSKSPSNVSAGSLPLSGKIFVFTGTLQSMGRAKAKEIVESLGGRSASDVSKSTDFLVSDGKIDGSKAAKAREYGTRVLSENEFLKWWKTRAKNCRFQPMKTALPPNLPFLGKTLLKSCLLGQNLPSREKVLRRILISMNASIFRQAILTLRWGENLCHRKRRKNPKRILLRAVLKIGGRESFCLRFRQPVWVGIAFRKRKGGAECGRIIRPQY